MGALYYLKLSIYPTGLRRLDKLRQISLAALSPYDDLRSPVVVNLAYSHEQSWRRSGYRSNRTGFPVSCLAAIPRWPVSMSPNLTSASQKWNEVEAGVTPAALRYSRASPITGTRLSQSLLIGVSSRAIRLLCVIASRVAALDTINVWGGNPWR